MKPIDTIGIKRPTTMDVTRSFVNVSYSMEFSVAVVNPAHVATLTVTHFEHAVWKGASISPYS